MKKVIATPDAPKAVGPYSQAIEVNGTLYISGQIPVNPADGKVQEDIVAAAHQSLKNIGAILKEAGMTYDNVVKTTVLLADIEKKGEGSYISIRKVFLAKFPTSLKTV